MLLSLFSGAGGLDLGFEQSGFDVGLAIEQRRDAVASYRRNRAPGSKAVVDDVRSLSLDRLDELWDGTCAPSGLIGGPPCQSFSQANQSRSDFDPRHDLPLAYVDLLGALNSRRPVPFLVMENVTGLLEARNQRHYGAITKRLEHMGFSVVTTVLDAHDHGAPQTRRRMILVALNQTIFPGLRWLPPAPSHHAGSTLTVRAAIGHLPHPVFWSRGLGPDDIPIHPNHWTTVPKSRRFSDPSLLADLSGRFRSFKTLSWDKPSLTVAYGNREIHVHPERTRRLSIYEALLLQGFPPDYVLVGSLSSQVLQVSEAVPPPLAKAVADTLPLRSRGGRVEPVTGEQFVFWPPLAMPIVVPADGDEPPCPGHPGMEVRRASRHEP